MKLQGTYTAIISPFRQDESFDFEAFEKLLKRQIDAGIAGVVVLGTTGEAPTVDIEETVDVLSFAKEVAGEKLDVIVGLTSNSTKTLTKNVAKINSVRPSAILSATPYYNKPTQKGIVEHFTRLADATALPIVLYNVPSRSGANINPETVAELAGIPHVVGVKEASGNLAQVREILESVPTSFSVLSGNDDQNVEVVKLGGRGTISVASNVIPGHVKRVIDAALAGDFESAESIDKPFADFYKDIFIENNPQAVKTLLAHLGLCREVFRLPMTTMLPENKERVIASWAAVEMFLPAAKP
jgi:4-hydroxy-tetrahydrodipicolinate synthase